MSITSSPKDFQIMFLDMNSFFASVEQQVQPILRDRPIGVAPYVGNTGCIIAASKEAKACGIKITRVGEAKKNCPDLKIIEARPALYMLYHKEIKNVIESFTPFFSPLSIDEFAIRISPNDQTLNNSLDLALKIKERIKDKVGDYLTCSIGIGPNKFLAKVAGERRKPDGLTAVRLNELKKFYSELILTDLPGINYRLEDQLKKFKINSPADLFNFSLADLRRVLNHNGRLWYFRLRGFEVDDGIVKSKTIGHSHVLPPELRSYDGAVSVIKKLIYKAGYRLRSENYYAKGAAIRINFLNGASFSLSQKFPLFYDNNSFMKNIFLLLKKCRWQSKPILISIAAFDLVKVQGEQISIFSDIEKSKSLSKAMDQINDEFGANTLFPASMFSAKDSAPDRIPFGSPRYEIRQ